MRKELLDNAGGIQAFGCYLAEDFFFAKAILVPNYRLVFLPLVVVFFVFRTKITSLQSALNQQLKTQAMLQSAIFKTGFPGICPAKQ